MKKPAMVTLGKNKKPVAVKCGARKKPSPKESAGFVTIGGKRIPFSKTENPDGYVVTSYGSEDSTAHTAGITLLVHTKYKEGRESWGTVACGEVLERGPATQRLQGVYRTMKGRWMFAAIRLLRDHPEAIHDPGHDEYSPGRMVREAILRDISSGAPHNLDLIAKCIEAVADLHRQETKGCVIVDLLGRTASKLGRIPTKAEIQDAALSDERIATAAADEGNFSKDLDRVGLGWLPVRL
jgi:hypothetical protein